jgi:hypothetical protein
VCARTRNGKASGHLTRPSVYNNIIHKLVYTRKFLYIYYTVSTKTSRGDRLNARCIRYGKK